MSDALSRDRWREIELRRGHERRTHYVQDTHDLMQEILRRGSTIQRLTEENDDLRRQLKDWQDKDDRL